MRYARALAMLMFAFTVQAAHGCQDYGLDGWKVLVGEAPQVFVGSVTSVSPHLGRAGGSDAVIRVDQPIRGSITGDYYSVEQYDGTMCEPTFVVGDRVIFVGADPGPVALTVGWTGQPDTYEQAQLDFVLSLAR